jgi:hypothetical protein
MAAAVVVVLRNYCIRDIVQWLAHDDDIDVDGKSGRASTIA